MNLSSTLDYVISISGFLIIIISFAWNIYDVFLRKSIHHLAEIRHEEHIAQSSDSAIR